MAHRKTNLVGGAKLDFKRSKLDVLKINFRMTINLNILCILFHFMNQI